MVGKMVMVCDSEIEETTESISTISNTRSPVMYAGLLAVTADCRRQGRSPQRRICGLVVLVLNPLTYLLTCSALPFPVSSLVSLQRPNAALYMSLQV